MPRIRPRPERLKIGLRAPRLERNLEAIGPADPSILKGF